MRYAASFPLQLRQRVLEEGRVTATSDGAIPLDALIKSGARDRPDVSLLASRDDRKLTVLAWHYHDDDVAGPAANVAFALEKLSVGNGKARVQQFRIDADHSNAYTAWKATGSPGSRRGIVSTTCRCGTGASSFSRGSMS